jgi:hypothetical protein
MELSEVFEGMRVVWRTYSGDIKATVSGTVLFSQGHYMIPITPDDEARNFTVPLEVLAHMPVLDQLAEI